MTLLEILLVIGLLGALAATAHLLLKRTVTGNAAFAAVLSAGFAAFTFLAIGKDGPMAFWTNHTANLVGVQVWWDLLLSVVLALFFLAPRARRVGMHVPLWALFVVCTASIGLLAMAARLFVLEKQVAEQS